MCLCPERGIALLAPSASQDGEEPAVRHPPACLLDGRHGQTAARGAGQRDPGEKGGEGLVGGRC